MAFKFSKGKKVKVDKDGNFSAGIELDLQTDFADVLVALSVQTDQNLVRATPKDEGRAQGNWQWEAGQDSADGELNNTKSNGTIKKIEDASFKQIFNNGAVVVNNLPYIERLNEGWSDQADSDYVDVEINNALLQIFGE